MSLRLPLISALLLLAGVSLSAAVPQPEIKLKLDPNEEAGGVLFKARGYPEPYELFFAPIRDGVIFGGGGLVIVKGPFRLSPDGKVEPGPPLLRGTKLKPGRYVVATLIHNRLWSACFARGTLGFTVVAGQLSYLGELDLQAARKSLFDEAKRTGSEQSNYGNWQSRYFEHIASLESAAPPSDIAEVRASAKSTLPDAPVSIIPQAPLPITFGQGEKKPKGCVERMPLRR